MKWNWQQGDWPNFSYKTDILNRLEKDFLYNSGIIFGVYKHFSEFDQNQIRIELISNEALNTSEIEGEYLNRDSLQASICRHFGLQALDRKISPAEQGISDLMINLYETYDNQLTHKTLYQWHHMLTLGRNDLQDVGRYRTNEEPMQVVSGPLHESKIHFEAPPSKQVKIEMEKFVHWFNLTGQASKTPLPALTRSGIAHLYFESIHPFEDGNGRIGRALSEKALAQALSKPTLIALSSVINSNKKVYYEALERANKRNEITAFLEYFAEVILEAMRYTQTHTQFMIAKNKLFDSLKGQINSRQEKLLLRLFREGPNGFIGGLSAKNYMSITNTSRATATRDLTDLLHKGALIKTGELKHARYQLNVYK